MFKKIEIWILYLSFIIFFIALILFGGILNHHYLGGTKFKPIQKVAKFIAQIPSNLKKIINQAKEPGIYYIDKSNRFVDKPISKIFLKDKLNGLLLLPRYDGDIHKFVVEVIDLKTFKVLHKFMPDKKEILNSFDYNNDEQFKDLPSLINKRFKMWHPYLKKKGELVFNSNSPLYKIDFCSNVKWVNHDLTFHHSLEIDHENNYWVPVSFNPSIIEEDAFKNPGEDGIAKISPNGKTLYKKSLTQILIDNGYKHLLYSQRSYHNDIIHLNDIQPALKDGPYWNKGDLFLSSKGLSAIIHYRPSTDKVVNMLRSPFLSQQHDVDIINDNTIYIFNNNRYTIPTGYKLFENSKIISYNFKTQKYSEEYESATSDNEIKTDFGGLFQLLDNGNFMIEEQEHGRLLIFNKEEELIWEFVNKSKKNKVYALRWSRIIKDQNLIKSFYEKLENTKCSNKKLN